MSRRRIKESTKYADNLIEKIILEQTKGFWAFGIVSLYFKKQRKSYYNQENDKHVIALNKITREVILDLKKQGKIRYLGSFQGDCPMNKRKVYEVIK